MHCGEALKASSGYKYEYLPYRTYGILALWGAKLRIISASKVHLHQFAWKRTSIQAKNFFLFQLRLLLSLLNSISDAHSYGCGIHSSFDCQSVNSHSFHCNFPQLLNLMMLYTPIPRHHNSTFLRLGIQRFILQLITRCT